MEDGNNAYEYASVFDRQMAKEVKIPAKWQRGGMTTKTVSVQTERKRQKKEPSSFLVGVTPNRKPMDLNKIVQWACDNCSLPTKKRRRISCLYLDGIKYYMAEVELNPGKYIRPKANIPIYTVSKNAVSVVQDNVRYFTTIIDAYKYGLYWILLKLKSKWFVDLYLKNLLNKCSGLDLVGEFLTIFYPDSRRGSEKQPRMVLCRTAKNNVSLFLVDGTGERVSQHETIHMNL